MNTPRFASSLPPSGGPSLLTDGGLETTLLFREHVDLPAFAAFVLLGSEDGRERLRRYYRTYLSIAADYGFGFILDTPTWRANPDWARSLGYSLRAMDAANRRAVQLMEELRREFADRVHPIWISGCIGPRRDGYVAGTEMTVAASRQYHQRQIAVLHDAGADLVTSFTLPGVHEAIGIVRAADEDDIPVVIGVTVETDGRLPSGVSLRQAIERVDTATASGPAYYMINCAHPAHFLPVLESERRTGDVPDWLHRIRAIRANASTKSHAELDAAATLDDGDPVHLGAAYRRLQAVLPNLAVVGGCCGTDDRHVRAICTALAVPTAPSRVTPPVPAG